MTEGQPAVTYTVRLATAPQAGENVTITASFDTSQLLITPTSGTLTAANWGSGITFTISAIDDSIDETSPMGRTPPHTATSNIGGSAYAGIVRNLSVSIIDNDPLTATSTLTPTSTRTNTPGAMLTSTATATATRTSTRTPTRTPTRTATPSVFVNASPTSISVTEGGTSVTYTVRLSAAPAPGEIVTINLTYDAAQISISPTSRQLSGSNWNTGRTFTASAVNDTLDEASPMARMITHSTDSTFAVSVWDNAVGGMVNVSIIDND